MALKHKKNNIAIAFLFYYVIILTLKSKFFFNCGRRIMVITLDFQSKDDGSIPFARSIYLIPITIFINAR